MKKNRVKYFFGVLIAACIMFFVFRHSFASFADEFTWNNIRSTWTYKEAEYPDGVYRLPLHVNEDAWAGYDRSVKRLRPAVGENWMIETCIGKIKGTGTWGCHYGLVVYKDQDNWLLWGQLNGDSTCAQGVIDGQGYEFQNVDTVYPYLRLSKEDYNYTFLCSENGENWVSMPGKFIDINHLLDDAKYGIMAKNYEEYNDFGATYNIQFNYFYEEMQ